MDKGGLVMTAALFDLGFAAFHVAFWPMLGWPRRLAPSGAVNAAVTQTLNLMLILVFGLYGTALLWFGQAADTFLLACGAIFWLVRLVLQPILFPLRAVWSMALAALFAGGALVHGLSALR